MRVRWTSLVMAMAALAFAAPALAQSAAINLDFEAGPNGQAPAGWRFNGAPGAAAITSAEAAHNSGLGVRISGAGETPQAAGILQTIDALPYRGQRVRLRAWAANTGQTASGGVFRIRAEGAAGQLLVRNTRAQPIEDTQWTRIDAIIPVPDDAAQITLSFHMPAATAATSVVVDSITLTPLGDAREGNAPPERLSNRGLDNLTALARLYGYVRYFHPSDEAASADWDALLLAGVERVEAAGGGGALRDALRDVFAPVAPSARITLADGRPPNLQAPTGDTLIWLHRGLGLGYYNGQPTPFTSERVAQRPTNMPDFGFLALPRGVIAYVPLRVTRRDGRTLPRASASAPLPFRRPEHWTPTGDDRTARLAAVIEAWNVPQHFYPQMQTQGVDWNAQLATSLRAAAEDADMFAFDRTMRRMTVALRDGHAGIERVSQTGVAPFAWEWIEDRLVVTGSGPGAEALRAGDVIIAINGRPVSELVAQAPANGATPAEVRWKATAFDILQNNAGDRLRLALERDGQTLDAALRFERYDAIRAPSPRPGSFSELAPGILYVDLARVTDAEVAAHLGRMTQARGIVFDMRGYPTLAAYQILAHLTDHAMGSDQFNVPIYTQPDQRNVTYENNAWAFTPEAPHIGGALVFMTDERAISYGESIMGVVENGALGPIVGAPSSGTNGNINSIDLLTGHTLTWTGLHVAKPDGSRRFGVGVQPTIPSHRTIAGVRAGRDEVLEAALAAAGAAAGPPEPDSAP